MTTSATQPDTLPSPPHPVFYKSENPDALQFEDQRERDGKVYAVRLKRRLLIQTPAVALATALVDADGEVMPFSHLAPVGHFAAFLHRTEAAVLAACLANKDTWFRGAVEDDALRAKFRTFFRPNGTVRVKVPEDVEVFDAAKSPAAPGDVPAGAQVRCILELAKISFGKSEFGASWKIVQVQALPLPRCLITDDAEGECSEDDDFYEV